MSGYSAFGPRGASTGYQDDSSGMSDYDFLPPQEEDDEIGDYLNRGAGSERHVEGRASEEMPDWGAEGRREPQMKQQQRLRQSPQGASDETEDEKVKDAAVEILPMIFANPPSIPAAFKSSELNQRHTLLRISPHDLDDYLVTGGPTSQPDTSTRVIDALEELKGHVEQLAGLHPTPQDALASVIHDVHWQVPEEGTLLASVRPSCGDARAESLAMILKREETEDEVAWKFHNLLPFGAAPGQWQPSFDAALGRSREQAPAEGRQGQELVEASSLPQHEEVRTRFGGEDFGATSRFAAPYAGSTGNGIAPASAEDAEDEEGEGKKAQHLYTNAEEFWGGWEGDDAQPGDAGDGAGGAGSAAADVGENEEGDDDYWNSYGMQGALDDDAQNAGEEDTFASTGLRTTGIAEAPAPALPEVGTVANQPTTSTHTTRQPPSASTVHRVRRDEHARTLLRSLVGLVQEGPEPVSEDEFLQWAREAFKEDQLERRGAAAGEGRSM